MKQNKGNHFNSRPNTIRSNSFFALSLEYLMVSHQCSNLTITTSIPLYDFVGPFSASSRNVVEDT